MAKPVQPAAPAATAAPAAAAPGTGLPPSFFDLGIPLPALKRNFGDGRPNPYADVLKTFPAPAADGSLASKFYPVEAVAATITDPAEVKKAQGANLRKLANSITGAARRIVDKDATYNFTARTVEENGVHGVRVFRIAPEAPKPPKPVVVPPAPPAATGAPLPPPPAPTA